MEAVQSFHLSDHRGSPRGAAASAFIYSLVETAKADGWEPRTYLQVLFEKYPTPRNDEERSALAAYEFGAGSRGRKSRPVVDWNLRQNCGIPADQAE